MGARDTTVRALQTHVSPAWVAVIFSMAITFGGFIWSTALGSARNAQAAQAIEQFTQTLKEMHSVDSSIIVRQDFNSYRLDTVCEYLDHHLCPHRESRDR